MTPASQHSTRALAEPGRRAAPRRHSLAQLAHKAAQQRLLPPELVPGQPGLPLLAVGRFHHYLHGCEGAKARASSKHGPIWQGGGGLGLGFDRYGCMEDTEGGTLLIVSQNAGRRDTRLQSRLDMKNKAGFEGEMPAGRGRAPEKLL